MKILLALLFSGMALAASGQQPTSFTVIDFVKIKNNRTEEVLYFYENNWKVYRTIALQKGYISSFQVLRTLPRPNADYDLVLITQYGDSTRFALREEHFQAIIKEVRPNGPKLLNEVKPADFREIIDNINTQTLFAPEAQQKRPGK